MKFYLTHTTKPSDSEDFLCSSSPRNCSALIPLSTAVTAIFPHQHKNKNPQKPIKSNSNKIQFCDTPFTTPTLIRNGHTLTFTSWNFEQAFNDLSIDEAVINGQDMNLFGRTHRRDIEWNDTVRLHHRKKKEKKKEGKRKRKSERRERGFPNVGGQTLNTVLECDMLCCCCCCYFYYPSVTALSHFLSPTLHNKVSFSFAKKSNLSLSKKSENLLPFFFNFIYLELRWCWRWRWDSEIHFGVWSQWPFFSDPYATK